ncbi:Putative transposable element, partial [Caligus rogercresseyi]
QIHQMQKDLNNMKSNVDRILIFPMRKLYSGSVFNRKNDRYISHNGHVGSEKYVSMTKHPASIMMLGVVGSDGKAMPPVFFQEGYMLTSEDYIKVLKTQVVPWIRKEYACKRVCFQQDGALAHTAKNRQKWLKENVEFWPENFWSPSSPVLNP